MRDYNTLFESIERVINKYNQLDKQKRAYGTDIYLTNTEIHLVAAIGDNPNINITELAKLKGVTKGAVSQIIYKLVDKGLVEKKISTESDAQVNLNLTKTGAINYNGHIEYHKMKNKTLCVSLETMNDDNFDMLNQVISEFERILEERM
jgi:DNA-binding MarR family transcriptional regulator